MRFRLLNQMMPVAHRRQRHLLSALTPEERAAFYACIEKLRSAAEQRVLADSA